MLTVSDQIVLLFSGFGSFNCLLLALYFLSRRPLELRHIFLGLALAALALRVFKATIKAFNPDISVILLEVGLIACALIGPLMLFHALAATDRLARHPVAWQLHLLGLFAALVTGNLIFPYHLLSGGVQTVVYTAITLEWVLYQSLALWTLRGPLREFLWNARSVERENILAVATVLGTWLISLGYLAASHSFYLLATLMLSVLLLCGAVAAFLLTRKRPKYGGKTIERPNERIAELERIMAQTRMFTNPDLTIAGAAKRLNQPKAQLSQLLNEALQMTFSEYVNKLRVEEAMTLLQRDPDQSVDEVATASGFNSQSTFYAAFKKVAGTTPGAFKRSLKPENDFREDLSAMRDDVTK